MPLRVESARIFLVSNGSIVCNIPPSFTLGDIMVKKVIVFGSCILDMFFDVPDMGFFVSTGVGAEDALHFATHQQASGGKGANQAAAAAKAGAKVSFYGAVGEGAHARYLLESLRDLKVNISGVARTKAPTGVAVIFNKPDGSHKVVVSHGANRLMKHSQVPDSKLNSNTICIFQAEADLKQNSTLMGRASKAGATVVLNVAPASNIPAKTLSYVDYLIVNRAEAETLAEHLGMAADDLGTFAEAMTRKFDLTIFITLGENGVLAAWRDGDHPVTVPSLKIKAVDTIGAGDAFVGAFVAALAEGADDELALRHGVVAGSLACTRIGAQSALPTAKEITKHLGKLGGKAEAKPASTKRRVAKK